MERWEKVNKIVKPLDDSIGAVLSMLDKAGIYEPMKDKATDFIRSFIKMGFERDHEVTVEGLENIPENGGIILAPNHQSWLDVQLIGAYCSRKPTFIAKAMFDRWPFLNRLIDITGAMYIKRGGDKEGLNQIADAVKDGKAVVIFPEGTIPGEEDIPRWEVEKDTGLLPGKTGVIRLHLMTGAPIIPVGVSGTGRALPPEMYPRLEKLPLKKKLPLKLKFGEPISFANADLESTTKEELHAMTKTVMKGISKLVDFDMHYIPVKLPISRKTEPDSLPDIPIKSKKLAKGKKAEYGFLVIHGFTSNIECVAPIENVLKKYSLPYRFPVLKGHGTTYEDMKGTGYDDWYNDAENTLLDLSREAKNIIIIGHSMGGLVGLELAARHRDKVSAMIALAPALKLADPMVIFSPILVKMFDYWDSPPAFADKELEAKYNKNYPKFATDAFLTLYQNGYRVANLLSFIKAPILIIHSKKDSVVAPKAAKLAFDKVSSKDKEIIWLEKTNHELMLDNEAETVLGHIDSFIKRIVPEPKKDEPKPAAKKPDAARTKTTAAKPTAKKTTTTNKKSTAAATAKKKTTTTAKKTTTKSDSQE